MALPEFPEDSQRYPEESQATTVLVLGIVGIFVSIVAPFAWIMGNNELKAIDSGRRSPENRSSANAGRILAIVGTVLLVLGFVVLAVLLVVLFSWDVFESTT